MESPRPSEREDDGDSTEETDSTHSAPNRILSNHLMRQHRNRDPMSYFDVVRVLGFGSIGSVSQVKKKSTAIGGSSRRSFVKENRGGACLSFPIIGRMIQMFVGDREEQDFWSAPKKEDLHQHEQRESTAKPVIGSSFSYMMGDKQCNVNFALKTIHLQHITDPEYIEELKNEIDLLKQLDHPNIVRAIETFDYRDQLFMVLELCSGGDLFTRDPYSESDAARIVCSILSAVEYMHSKNITHRDLKYENIMFTSEHPDADVKIIDFGLSAKYAPNDSHFRVGVGTVYTMAPEVVSGYYTAKADIWSVGVLAFMLLSSQMPFHGKRREDVIRRILQCRYRMREKSWKHVSLSAKEFVTRMLQVDSTKRPSAGAALRSPWLHHVLQERSNASDGIVEDVQAAMQRYGGYSTLKKLALMVVSHKSTSAEIGFLQKVFRKFDSQQEGHISFPKFKEGWNNYGCNEKELVEMFYGADLDKTGVLRYTEFLASTIEVHGLISEERLAEAFDRLDSDDSGYITAENLRELLGHLPKEYLDKVIDEADLTQDHKISYKEFLAMWDHTKEGREKAQKELQGHKTSMTESLSGSESVISEEDEVMLAKMHFREKKGASLRKFTRARVLM